MAEVVTFVDEEGQSFMRVEVDTTDLADDNDVDLVVEHRDGATVAVTRLEDSLRSVEGAAVALMSTVNALREREEGFALSEVALQLSLSFGLEGGVVVARGKASAEATVTLTWRRPAEG